MAPTAGDGDSTPPQTLTGRIMSAFTGPPSRGGSEDAPERHEIMPQSERKAAMTGLDRIETKWALGGLILAAVAGIGIPAYYIIANPMTKEHGKYVAVSPDAGLLGGVILLFTALGFLALWKRRRTLVAFALFVIGLAFTVFILPIGFAFIVLGGWLMLRAWRISKYGTTDSKVIRRVAATQPRGKNRKEAAKATSKTTTSGQDARRPPTASKRYTPKAPTRKKVPKATE
jgi:hypothetical protein